MATSGIEAEAAKWAEATREYIRKEARHLHDPPGDDPFERFPNAGEIWMYEEHNDFVIHIGVPLPYLIYSGLLAEDVERYLQELCPSGYSIVVEIPRSAPTG